MLNIGFIVGATFRSKIKIYNTLRIKQNEEQFYNDNFPHSTPLFTGSNCQSIQFEISVPHCDMLN